MWCCSVFGYYRIVDTRVYIKMFLWYRIFAKGAIRKTLKADWCSLRHRY